MATTDTTSSKVENPEEFGEGDRGKYLRWNTELKIAGKNEKDWIERSDKIIKRYRDERKAVDKDNKKFNILWSNTETLKKALYARPPIPQVDRRYRDKDPIGLKAAMVLERATSYVLEDFDMDHVMRSAVLDYQLPGRAVTRVFYRPQMVTRPAIAQPISYEPPDYLPNPEMPEAPIEVPGAPIYSDDAYEIDGMMFEDVEELVTESAEAMNVYWKDFRMGKAREWRQVPWVAFRAYMSRKELEDRFGEIGKKVPCNHRPENISDEDIDDGAEILKKAEIWEIWDKVGNEVLWISPGFDQILDSSDPHLKFDQFFPCTEPLIMTQTTDTMEPVPEYVQYQDQAQEIDELTVRINLIVEAIRVAGVYDQNAKGVQKILESEAENRLYPITNWQQFIDKGGLEAAIAWLPVEQLVKVLQVLYESRERTKQELYEITGLSDIMRGASDPRETAAAQKIKGRFGSMRLQDKQDLVAQHARDIIRLLVEVIAENFSEETLRKMTGLTFEGEEDEQMDMQEQQALQAPMQPGMQMPMSQQPQESGEEVWAKIMELLRNDPIRSFKISIETDSTIQPNEQEEKENRVEFLKATGEFMTGAMQIAAQQPLTTPLVLEMLLFGIRGFRAGRELEQRFEEVAEKINAQVKQQMANPQPQPDPKMIEAQGKMQAKQAETQQRLQADQQKHEQDMQQDQERHMQEMMQRDQERRTNTTESVVKISNMQRESQARTQAMNRPRGDQ